MSAVTPRWLRTEAGHAAVSDVAAASALRRAADRVEQFEATLAKVRELAEKAFREDYRGPVPPSVHLGRELLAILDGSDE